MMNKRIIKLFALLLMCMLSTSLQAQITEKATFGKFAIVGADLYTITGDIIEGGTILVNGKKIEKVGKDLSFSSDYTKIDASGKRIYPGLIDSGTLLGLREIESIPLTQDQAEVGAYNPQMRAFTAINPNSVNIPVTRVSGVTTVIAHPVSGVISGKATLINLYGYTPDSMAVVQDAALVLDFPSDKKRGRWDRRKESEVKKQYSQILATLDEKFTKAAYYKKMRDAGNTIDKDPEIEALIPVMEAKMPIMVNVDSDHDILNALDWIKTHPDLKFVLSSVAEGWRVADKIAEASVPCLVGPILRTANRSYDKYDAPYTNAAKLHEAGVLVAIRTGETENVRNLPFNAGFAAAWGMGTEAALEAVTINPAKIFMCEDKLGSIEEGKMANLVICDGDIFEPKTQVEHVFIGGNSIPMTSRHEQLYREFIERGAKGSK